MRMHLPVALVVATAVGLSACGSQSGPTSSTSPTTSASTSSSPTATASPSSSATLTAAEISGLNQVLDGEYHAQAMYKQAVSSLGTVSPFDNLVPAEGNHISALLTIYSRYGISAPADAWSGKISAYATRNAACSDGLQLEQANLSRLQQLMPATSHSDIKVVYQNLLQAIQDNHIPALSRC